MKNDCNFLKNAVTWLWFLANFDRYFQHFAVTFRIMTATFYILRSHFELWLQLSNYDCKMLKVAVTWLQFQNLQSNFELWLYLATFYSHISNYDCNFQHFAVTFRIMTAKCWKLQSRDCRFQFAVIVRNVTVTFEGVYNFRSLYFVSVKIIRFPIFLENNWLSLSDMFFALAICPAAGQIAFETFFCYLSGRRTNSLKWYQMPFVRLPIYKTWKLFHQLPSCNSTLL